MPTTKPKQSQSSIIKRCEYNAETKVLTITFTTDVSYTYSGVPQSTVNQLTTAESMGMYFHKHIRNKYPATKVD